jgi:hypothetical protein
MEWDPLPASGNYPHGNMSQRSCQSLFSLPNSRALVWIGVGSIVILTLLIFAWHYENIMVFRANASGGRITSRTISSHFSSVLPEVSQMRLSSGSLPMTKMLLPSKVDERQTCILQPL